MTDLTKTALDILLDEVRGDVAAALKKMDKSYTMTWMYHAKDGVRFPRTQSDFVSDMKEAYIVKGRKYEIVNVAEGENVVIIELIESYPGENTGGTFRTPLVLVIEFADGKIIRGRHYCDPQLSYEQLSEEEISASLGGSSVKQVIA